MNGRQTYQARVGLPLTSYKEKWQSLRQVPPSTCPASSEQARAGGRRLKRLQYLAQEYFASEPGPDNGAPNVGLHGCLHQVLKGATYPKKKVQELTEITAYRLGAMYEADYLREQIGLKFPSIFEVETNLMVVKMPITQLSLNTWSLLQKFDINTTPIGIHRPYVKPLQSVPYNCPGRKLPVLGRSRGEGEGYGRQEKSVVPIHLQDMAGESSRS